jgi:transcriptional accessory protein Tex/SPT6
VKHPSEVLKVGDEVDVFVLSVNPTEKKIALSIKRTQPEPWSRVASKYAIGQVVPAAVLAGVFKVLNLEQAQARGLALLWSHDLDKLGAFISSTKAAKNGK